MSFTADAAQSVGPLITSLDPDGNRQNGFLSASPYDNADHVLLLTCSTVSRPTEDTEILLSYGGFDAPEVMNDTSKHAVSCLWPCPESRRCYMVRLSSYEPKDRRPPPEAVKTERQTRELFAE